MKKDTLFIDWFISLLRHKRLLILNSFLALFITYGITLLLPVWFESHVSILPPYNRTATIPSMGALGGMLGIGGGGGDFSMPIMTTQPDLWAAIINSPALIDTIVVNENFMERYNSKSLRKAREKFQDHLSVGVTKEGILNISFEDKDPEYAAYIANLIVEELDRVIVTVKSSVSRDTRIFLERRLEETRNELAMFEDSLAEFQKKYGAVAIESQAKILIEQVAQIQAELVMTNIELGIAERSYSSDHARIVSLKTRKNELSRQLKRIEQGDAQRTNITQIPLSEVPQLALEYTRLVRETTARELLYSFIIQQYEQARIDEKRDTPSVKVLSAAIPRDEKSRPRRSIISAIAAFLVLLFTSAMIILNDYTENLAVNDPHLHSKIKTIKRNIFSWKFKD